ncbi:hypothetical protein K402DRAFT_397010 [Aulographum hederae CBS 113979]|uniref:DUF6594 domain-containing protein n=1 Tax=Aulographum hederae CBS 113979 TaxID=1176131 RepID=A0A6G1GQI9_9PEZI|nr:hypothetical protein K402DRAFT_397010 [Aulographum hederae CBS 113979]
MESSSADVKPIPLAHMSRVPSTPNKTVISPASTFATLVESPQEQTENPFHDPKPKVDRKDSRPSPLVRRETSLVEDDALHGYPKLAAFIGGANGCAIYKRFASLNARNLLYHQAKLVALEHELNDLEHHHSWCKDLQYKVDHIFHAEPGSAGYELRMKHEEVSDALKEYNRLLLEQQKLHKLPQPDDTYVNSIHNFIHNVKAGEPNWLSHPENTIYAVWDDDRKAIQRDLVTLKPAYGTQDTFTRLFNGAFLYSWHKLFSRFGKPDDEIDGYNYHESTLSRYMTAIVMVVASALPTTSIIALYYIHEPLWRLIFIVLYGGIFAACLAFFTEARRVEIFGASVALAGVQVVFVGTAFGN